MIFRTSRDRFNPTTQADFTTENTEATEEDTEKNKPPFCFSAISSVFSVFSVVNFLSPPSRWPRR